MGKYTSGETRCRLASIILTVLFFCLLIAACHHQPEMPSFSTETTVPLELEPAITPQAEATTSIPEPTSAPSSQPTAIATTESQNEIGNRNELNGDFYWITLDEKIKQRITGFSYPEDDSNIQIHYDDLCYIKLLHYDFTGDVHEGELIVHATLADEVMEIFYQLYLAEYPLTSVLLVDEFGQSADDTLSMEANNTSAFNYRFVTGTQTLSRHSFGAAIDINPMLNPYIVGDRILPENGKQYADRSRDFPGKIDHDDLCYMLFTEKGWTWGGDWAGYKDYQHFSKKIN